MTWAVINLGCTRVRVTHTNPTSLCYTYIKTVNPFPSFTPLTSHIHHSALSLEPFILCIHPIPPPNPHNNSASPSLTTHSALYALVPCTPRSICTHDRYSYKPNLPKFYIFNLKLCYKDTCCFRTRAEYVLVIRNVSRGRNPVDIIEITT